MLSDGRLDAGGILHGSLYLQGGGDPALGTPAFYNGYLAGLGTNLFALVPQIRAAGIRAITGRLYADDTIFDRLRGVADSGYATSSYIGPLSGLAFNSGFAARPAPAASPPTRPSWRPRSWPRSLSASRRRGAAAGRAGEDAGASAEQVAVVRSPTLTQIVDTTDVYSNNFFAEMLLKLLGARLGGAGTTAAGAAVVERFARGARLRRPRGRRLRPDPLQPRLAAPGRRPAAGHARATPPATNSSRTWR